MDGLRPQPNAFSAKANASTAKAHAWANNPSYTRAITGTNPKAQCRMSNSCAQGGVREVL